MSNKHDIRAICRVYFEIAKQRYSAALVCRLLVFGVSILNLFKGFYEYSRLATLLLIPISEYLTYLSDKNKSLAETLLRKLDAQDSFGWAISNAEVSDVIVNCPPNIKKFQSKDEYFASQQQSGARRAVENFQESAWWSKHLAQRMGNYYLIGTVASLLILIIVIFVAITTTQNISALSILANVLMSAFLLIFSLGLLRLMNSYYKFSNTAEKVEKSAEQLLLIPNINESDALKMMFEYHLARANAPLLPTWLWKSMSNNLNQTWREYRQKPI